MTDPTIISAQAATLSAWAAGAAAVAAAAVAIIQLVVGIKQANASLLAAKAAMLAAESEGRHTVAEFRQRWIDKVIDTISDYHALLLLGARNEDGLTEEDTLKQSSMRTKLEILLNPNEKDTIDLLAAVGVIRRAKTHNESVDASPDLVKAARTVLKAEWVRIKAELR